MVKYEAAICEIPQIGMTSDHAMNPPNASDLTSYRGRIHDGHDSAPPIWPRARADRNARFALHGSAIALQGRVQRMNRKNGQHL